MRPLLILVLLIAGCDGSHTPVAPSANVPITTESLRWDMQSSGEGAALVVESETGSALLRLFCPSGAGKLLVNVPRFKPIGSEERLSFGQGGVVEALVADPLGDTARGGVTGAGPVPSNLVLLLSGRVSASYGEQVSGPHPVPPVELVAAFAGVCLEGTPVGN